MIPTTTTTTTTTTTIAAAAAAAATADTVAATTKNLLLQLLLLYFLMIDKSMPALLTIVGRFWPVVSLYCLADSPLCFLDIGRTLRTTSASELSASDSAP